VIAKSLEARWPVRHQFNQESLFVRRCFKTAATLISAAASSVLFGMSAQAGDQPPAAAAPSATSLELNKLETYDKGCRAYMVVNNTTDIAYSAFKLDLVLFQTDGVIGRRFALDLAPVRAQKKTVKLFELDGIACDKIGSFLINDVMDCKTETGPAESCLQKLTVSTLTTVQLSK
jgi:hypothetical protein